MFFISKVAEVEYGFLWGNAKGTLGILSSMLAHAEVFDFGDLGLEVDYVLGYEI